MPNQNCTAFVEGPGDHIHLHRDLLGTLSQQTVNFDRTLGIRSPLASPQNIGRPVNRQVAVFGDSRSANAILVNGTTNQFYARGLLNWARVLSKQAFDHATTDVTGTGGFTSAQVLASIQTGLPLTSAGTIVVLCSTNDRAAFLPASTSITNLLAIQNLVRSYGKVLIWLNEMPRGSSNVLAGSDLAAHLSVVSWLNAQSSIPGVYVANSFGRMVDPTSSSASPLSALFADGLHPDGNGSYVGPGQALLPIINSLFPYRPTLAPVTADAYDATNNPRGVLNANPMMTGTGGTKNVGAGTSFTGSVADNYTANINNGTGVTVVASKVTTTTFGGVAYTDVASKDWQQFVISGTPTSASANLTMIVNTSVGGNIALGDVIDQTVEFEIDAGQTGLNGVDMEGVGSSFNRRDMATSSATETYPTAAVAGVFRIGPFVAAAGESGFYKPQMVMALLQSVAVNATIRFRALAVRKVI